LAGPAPTAEDTALSPEWLTAALTGLRRGISITAVEVNERIRTVASKIRFTVTYADASSELPVNFCIKGLFVDESTPMRPGLATEPVFYRDVGPTLGIRIPPCPYAGVDEAAGNGLVIMHDLKAEGAVFGDPEASCTPDQSALVLDELARLHAETWGRTTDRLPAELAPRLDWLTGIVGPELLSELFADGRAEGIPTEVADGSRIHAAMHAMAALDSGPKCLVHGDLHTGNMYWLPDGSPGLIDWQVVQLGSWALDLAYHLSTALEPAQRAERERDLLDHYLDRLRSHGVVAPDRDHAWRLYRSHLPYGFFMWGITRFTPRPWIEHFVRRIGIAVTEHRSLELLGV
jgi:hypothetical protein